ERPWRSNQTGTVLCDSVSDTGWRYEAYWTGSGTHSLLVVRMLWSAPGLGWEYWVSDPFPLQHGDCFLEDSSGSLVLNYGGTSNAIARGPCGQVNGSNSMVIIYVD
ncbi:MAG: hypothetical protein KDA96_19080, partial [Planctomycetaceae bacterium]|nr:hypothetical protein [Planctomycetaceae bacterium]